MKKQDKTCEFCGLPEEECECDGEEDGEYETEDFL
jgi:hypothetical protein